MRTPLLLAMCFAVAAALMMATIGVVARYTALSAEVITLFRLGLGAFLLLPLLLWRQWSPRSQHASASSQPLTTVGTHALRTRLTQQLLNGVLLASFILFYIKAIGLTSMAYAIVMVYLAPLVAALWQHLRGHERLQGNHWLPLLAAVTGFTLMQWPSDQQTFNPLGFGYSLLSMLCYALYILVNRRGSSQHVLSNTFWQLGFGALLMLPFALSQPWPNGAQHWMWLLFAGVMPGFLAIYCAVRALAQLPAAL